MIEVKGKAGGKTYALLEHGLAVETQEVARLSVNGQELRAVPVPVGSIVVDITGGKGGTVTWIQADSLADLVAGKVRTEAWTIKADERPEPRGVAPLRRFVVLVVNGEGLEVELRPLGQTMRGPSSWKFAPGVIAWGGV